MLSVCECFPCVGLPLSLCRHTVVYLEIFEDGYGYLYVCTCVSLCLVWGISVNVCVLCVCVKVSGCVRYVVCMCICVYLISGFLVYVSVYV